MYIAQQQLLTISMVSIEFFFSLGLEIKSGFIVVDKGYIEVMRYVE